MNSSQFSCSKMLLAVLLPFALLIVVNAEICPPWRLYDFKTKECKCAKTIHLVNCDSKGQLSISHCYCMTFNEELKEVTIGQCLYSCVDHRRSSCHEYDRIKSNSSLTLNFEECGLLKRTGHLCGDCIKDYGYPIYSYSMECVKCNKDGAFKNIVKYVLLAFGPLTIFYMFVIIFKFSITSNFMVAYIYTCQTVTVPYLIKMNNLESFSKKALVAYISMWNLDFFRLIIDPFCLHPNLSILQVISLDYIVAVYPMFLVILTFFAVLLHDRYAIIVFLWSPVEKMMKCIRKNWNIRGSLIQAFATFFVLSYVKILNVSFELLTPVVPFNEKGEHLRKWYLFSAGTIEYFGKHHLPYGILAVAMLLIFNVLPVILLILYPFNWFKSCACKNDLVIFTFLDAFYGCYRTKPIFCRSFAAVYFIMRLLELVIFVSLRDRSVYFVFGLCQVALCVLITLFQPYSKKYQNSLDVILILNLASILFMAAAKHSTYATIVITAGLNICIFIHISYSLVLLGFHLFPIKYRNLIKHYVMKEHEHNDRLPLLSHH